MELLAASRRSFIIFIFLAFSGCSLQSFSGEQAVSFSTVSCAPQLKESKSVLVTNVGWHTGFFIRSMDATEVLRTMFPELSQSPFVEIGWGDKGFYMSSGYSWWHGFRALFFSPGSVLHVAGFDETEASSYLKSLEVFQIYLSDAEFAYLMDYIKDSVVIQGGRPISLGAALYGHGAFYESRGRFSLFYTCNSWTSEGLVKAGCKIRKVSRASNLLEELRALGSGPLQISAVDAPATGPCRFAGYWRSL
jgi:uncharacterized protein (TIGR02117 family)